MFIDFTILERRSYPFSLREIRFVSVVGYLREVYEEKNKRILSAKRYQKIKGEREEK